MTIAQVSKQYDISADTLRYYERIGLMPAVTRNASGNRDYTEFECNWIEYIKCMRTAGVSIETLTEYIRLFRENPDGTADLRKALLVEQRAQIAAKIKELQNIADKLDTKLDVFESVMLKNEQKLISR